VVKPVARFAVGDDRGGVAIQWSSNVKARSDG